MELLPLFSSPRAQIILRGHRGGAAWRSAAEENRTVHPWEGKTEATRQNNVDCEEICSLVAPGHVCFILLVLILKAYFHHGDLVAALASSCCAQVHLAMVRYHEAGRFCEKDEQWDQDSAFFHLERAALCEELEAIVALGQCYLQLPHHILPDMSVEVRVRIHKHTHTHSPLWVQLCPNKSSED